MARHPGKPSFPNKSVNGSYYLTKYAAFRMKALVKRFKASATVEDAVSASDLIELGLRLIPATIDREGYEALVKIVRDQEAAGVTHSSITTRRLSEGATA